MSRIRRILHPTDFSRASSAAYKRAVGMASRAGPRGPAHGGWLRLPEALRGHGSRASWRGPGPRGSPP